MKLKDNMMFGSKTVDIIVWIALILYLIGVFLTIFILLVLKLGWRDGIITTVVILVYIGYLAWLINN